MARKTQDREWFLYPDGDPLTVAADDDMLGSALGEVHTILSRLGGNIIISANRAELAPGVWETVAFSFRWLSYSPSVTPRQESPEPAMDSEPEPAAA